MVPLTPDELLQQQAAGAQVLDVRDPADFEGAHLAGAISILENQGITDLIDLVGGLGAREASNWKPSAHLPD